MVCNNTNADNLVNILRRYSQEYLSYKIESEFARAVEEAATILERLNHEMAVFNKFISFDMDDEILD